MKRISYTLYIVLSILFFTSCSKEDNKQDFCIEGVWMLEKVTSPEGYTYSYPENDMTWMRIYDDSCYYMCQIATAPNGTMIIPSDIEDYTFVDKGPNYNLYLQGSNTYPLTIESDSVMVIQENGSQHTWKLCQNFDEERVKDIVRIIKSDVAGGDRMARSYVFSKAEKSLKATNHTLVYTMIAIIVVLLIIVNYVYRLYQNKKRIEQELRRIEEEHKAMPEPVRQALNTVEADFHQSDFYLMLHKRIANGERLRQEDWDAIESNFRSVYPGFINSLMSLYKMSQVEYQVCLLLKLNVTPSEIASTLCKDSSSISTVRSRLYQKVFGKKGSSKDWDEFIHSL